MEIGPALPPHLAKKLLSSGKEDEKNESGHSDGRSKKDKASHEDRHPEEKQNKTVTDEYKPYGPPLPPGLRKESNKTEDVDSDEDEAFGPALPPGFHKRTEIDSFSASRIIGPARPQSRTSDGSENDEGNADIIGPMPPAFSDADLGFERTKLNIEARSQATKDHLTVGKGDAKLKRETWMTELPSNLSKNFGLGPRKFRARAVEVGDQSVWTDTPSEKARKLKEGEKGCKRCTDEEPKRTPWEFARDQEMSQEIQHYNKRHRGESLMDMHKKKLDKEKSEAKIKAGERRPFDRDKDLSAPQMNAGQKKSVIEKSKQLGSRFQNARSGSSYL